MKKIFISLLSFTFLFNCNALAEVFDNLENISPLQQEQLTQIHEKYKQTNNLLETKIMDFNSKILKIQKESDKKASDILLLTSAYQRNIDSLKAQQEELAKKLDEDYKSVLSEEQFKQYELQKGFAQAAFDNFLQK